MTLYSALKTASDNFTTDAIESEKDGHMAVGIRGLIMGAEYALGCLTIETASAESA